MIWLKGTARIRIAFPPREGRRGYDVLVRDGILDELARYLPDASSYFLVTDSNVARLFGKKVRARLAKSKRAVKMVVLQAGERSKSIETAWRVASELNRLGGDRRSLVLALGGGVVGDLAGFVSSIFKRGIGYVQLPTTLLAQVDSSIGGKTGVDTPWGKNQLGTFHQPRLVLTDPTTLRTLPHREVLNGLAEVVKCAIIADRRMFHRISELSDFDSEVPRDLIVDACRVKASIVSRDPEEANLRSILNYGHTVGHAIESSNDYRFSHGACVVLGMIAEGWIAHRLGILQRESYEEQTELLTGLYRSFGTRLPAMNKTALFSFAVADKKSSPSSVRMSLPSEIGKMHSTEEGSYTIPVSKGVFSESIDYLRSQPFRL